MQASKYSTLYSDTRNNEDGKFKHKRAGSIAIISNKTMDAHEADYGEVGKID